MKTTPKQLSQKVALVTGGSRGIGAAIVRRLGSEQANVAFTYLKAHTAAKETISSVEAAGSRALAIIADNADPKALEAAVDQTAAEFGRLDILVCSAGQLLFKPVEAFELVDFDRMVAVDLRAAFVATRAASRHMHEGGRIIFIGSNIAQYAALPMTSLYSMVKSGLVGLAKGLARDLGPRGITVNVVEPGPIETDANPADSPYSDQLKGRMVTPRYGKGEDVAGLAAYLASNESQFATGAVFTIDNGFTA